MKRLLIVIILVIIISFTFSIPKYVELNNLVIIDTIGVKCNKSTYSLYLEEIIPTKKDTGIVYRYKLYEDTNYSLNSAYKSIIKSTDKKIYINDVRYVVTDCDKSNDIIKYFNIKPNYIKHTKSDIRKELK